MHFHWGTTVQISTSDPHDTLKKLACREKQRTRTVHKPRHRQYLLLSIQLFQSCPALLNKYSYFSELNPFSNLALIPLHSKWNSAEDDTTILKPAERWMPPSYVISLDFPLTLSLQAYSARFPPTLFLQAYSARFPPDPVSSGIFR